MPQESKRLENENLKLLDNIDDNKNSLVNVGLICTSSAFKYCPNPLRFLEYLVESNATNLFITQTSFPESSYEITRIQASKLSSNRPGPLLKVYSGPNTKYPITYVSRKTILDKKYDIRFMPDKGGGVFGLNAAMISSAFTIIRKNIF